MIMCAIVFLQKSGKLGKTLMKSVQSFIPFHLPADRHVRDSDKGGALRYVCLLPQ